jgi:iron complex outermembrane receptor protein
MFRSSPASQTLFFAALLGLSPLSHADDTATTLPDMTVEGEAAAGPSLYQVELEQAPVTTPDTAELLRRAPGASVNRNGPLTGIAQYRGMYGDRVNVMVNGMRINTGGPNGMDPALSYIPRSQLQSLEVIRGIAPVSSGAETIGGTIMANGRSSEFGSSDRLTSSLELTGGGATVNDSGNGSAMGTIANRNHRLHVIGSRENGGNIEYSDGKIRPSRHERNNFGTGYGFRTGSHEFSFDIRRNETDPTGTPALPMDIIDINTSIVQGNYSGDIAGYAVNAKAFWSDVNHHMSNYELRDAPVQMGSPMTRLNDATSDGLGYRLDTALPMASGVLTLGVDGHLDDHDSTITDPVNNLSFRVENFNDVERDLFGFFAEWNGAVLKDWDLQLGGRYNLVKSDAGDVFSSMAMMNPGIMTLQNRFNAADRDQSENNFDLAAKLSRPLSTQTTLVAEVGHKTRAPSYQERYLWLPLQATNGLADGNNYVGNIELDSEKAYEVGLGLDWYGRRAYFEPRVFYRYVDDYIQGTPSTDPAVIAVSTMGGDPTPLQFSNVDARLYGADAAWGVTLSDNWSVDGIVSYVRGERDDINDDLYRIAPLNGRASLTYRRTRWWASLEGIACAEQDRVSDTNDEKETDGYQLLNLRGGVEITRDLLINAGVENILDSTARDHLTGINRVADSDVGLGRRLPSPGRNFFATLQYHYN